jgi:vitamin B12 transporter
VNAVYFQRIDTRPIDFEAFYDGDFNFIGGQYFNADGAARVEGVEVDFRYIKDKWQLNGSHAWLNDVWGNLRQRVPRMKTVVGGSYQYMPNGTMSLNYTWTGKRRQLDPETFGFVNTPPFGLVDLALNHQLGKFTCYGSVNNVLDTQYDAILGYTTIGRNYTVGFRMNLTGK